MRGRAARGTFAGALIFILAAVSPGSAASSLVPVSCVVELFTSQGCAFCPPADALLASLARRQDVAAMSFSVDYWDYIGWKDTLAVPANAARQRAYAGVMGEHHAYTPQAIVNGVAGAVGSDRKEIEAAMASTRGRDGAMSLGLRAGVADGAVVVDVPDGPGGPAVVLLVRVARQMSVQIGRGENAGRKISYTNVVRQVSDLGVWSGAAASFRAPDARVEGEGYVVLVQRGSQGRPGAILAAAKSAGF
ncbi:DUF1223 domain-containing protein [Methylocella sp.]|uniref:DUF1223 domain-containing protein n=1 Tax=Methylocella sp. TaxID=1978226 RepID=UPI0035B400CB